ncbi:MAG: hypothetical protein AAFY91_02055 [Bacteroidota bacterium]
MKLLFTLLLFSAVFLSTELQAQSVLGGAGVCAVDMDPDLIPDMQDQDQRSECLVAWDNVNQALYVYNATSASGSRWQQVPLTAVSNTDTRLDNPRIVGDDLVFDIFDVISSSVLGSIPIPAANIAPVQGLIAGTGITITGPDANNEFTIINDAPNVDQTLTATASGDDAVLTLSDGGTVTLADGGDGIDINVSGNNVTISNPEAATIAAKNPSDAAGQGVAIGGYYYATIDNTMGAIPGTKLRRMF